MRRPARGRRFGVPAHPRVSSSPAPSTWWARRRPTSSCADAAQAQLTRDLRTSAQPETQEGHGLRCPDSCLTMTQAAARRRCSREQPRRAISPTARPRARPSSRRAPTYSPTIAEFISHFGWQGKVFDAEKGVLQNSILAVRAECDRRQGLQGRELARRQGMHRARLFRDFARRPLDPRRDPPDRPRASISARSTGARSG